MFDSNLATWLAEAEKRAHEIIDPLAEADRDAFAKDVAERAKSHVEDGPTQHAIRTRHGKDSRGDFIDVGVLRPAAGKTRSGTNPADAAVPDEYGHIDGSGHVAPHPFMRPGISEAIEALPREVKG